MKISKEIKDYMKQHPFCEACGEKAQGLPHHIKTRGSGGTDSPDNLLRLCHHCHFDIVHSKGHRKLIELYPHVADKIYKVHPGLKEITV